MTWRMRSRVIRASLALPFQIRQCRRSTSVTITALACSRSGVSIGRVPGICSACCSRRGTSRDTAAPYKYHRLKARRGAKRAAMAIAHKILIAAYHMLTEGTDYIELGEAYLDKLAETRITRGLFRRLTNLGYK